MRFFRRLQPFKAISFDLDDTLYDNHPVIRKAERALQHYLHENIPLSRELGRSFWLKQRAACLQHSPELKHDVTALRLAALQRGMVALGYQEQDAAEQAIAAVDFFLSHRNQITVSTPVKGLLASLAEKYPLVAISNGNVGLDKTGLDKYFKHSFFAGAGNLQKPEPDMFRQTCQRLSIEPSQLLHIGDCTHADIFGALRAGCQTIWIDNANFSIKKKPLKLLPNAQFDCVEQLAAFL